MININEYLAQRGISAKQMDKARKNTRDYIDAYNLREARTSPFLYLDLAVASVL